MTSCFYVYSYFYSLLNSYTSMLCDTTASILTKLTSLGLTEQISHSSVGPAVYRPRVDAEKYWNWLTGVCIDICRIAGCDMSDAGVLWVSAVQCGAARDRIMIHYRSHLLAWEYDEQIGHAVGPRGPLADVPSVPLAWHRRPTAGLTGDDAVSTRDGMDTRNTVYPGVVYSICVDPFKIICPMTAVIRNVISTADQLIWLHVM